MVFVAVICRRPVQGEVRSTFYHGEKRVYEALLPGEKLLQLLAAAGGGAIFLWEYSNFSEWPHIHYGHLILIGLSGLLFF